MRARWIALLLFLVTSSTADARAGALADALAATDDGRILFEYPTREGVRGDGKSLQIDSNPDAAWHGDCDDGPARVQLRVRDGAVVDVDVRVGGRWRTLRTDVVDLGPVAAAEAIDVLLSVAETGTEGDLEEAVLGAVIAEGFDEHARIVALVRDRDRPRDLRESALFWLGQAAGARATAELTRIVEDDDEQLGLRERAIFALSQRGIDECFEPLRRVATTNRHPQLREKAFFWLAQHDDPRVVELLEDVLLGDE